MSIFCSKDKRRLIVGCFNYEDLLQLQNCLHELQNCFVADEDLHGRNVQNEMSSKLALIYEFSLALVSIIEGVI